MTYNVFSGTLNPTHFTSLQGNVLYHLAFSALTLLVGQQEGHPACKNVGYGGGGHWSGWSGAQPDGHFVCL